MGPLDAAIPSPTISPFQTTSTPIRDAAQKDRREKAVLRTNLGGLGNVVDDDGGVCIPEVDGSKGFIACMSRRMSILQACGEKVRRGVRSWPAWESCQLIRRRPGAEKATAYSVPDLKLDGGALVQIDSLRKESSYNRVSQV